MTVSQAPALHDQRRETLVARTVLVPRIQPPRLGTSLGIGIGTLASLAPGLLPRSVGTQIALTGLLAALALGVAGILRALVRQPGLLGTRQQTRARMPVAVVMAVLVVGAVAHAHHWQNTLRAAMGAPRIAVDYWVRCGLGAAVVVGVCLGITHTIAWLLRTLGFTRAASVGIVLVLVLQFVGVPAVVTWGESVYARANAAVDPTVVEPMSGSGGPGSVVSWASLGAHGRTFVSSAPERAVAVYIGVTAAPDLHSRVALAIQELVRSGGFERSHLVVVVPTGSGWIDPKAVEGFDRRFDGDVALVGLQYSYLPSWASFAFGRNEAAIAARSLFTAVEDHLEGLAHKPKLYLYGQSLGALSGSAVFADDADQDRRTCATLWAGPPGGRVHRGGATVLANSSDPVIWWSPSLLWRPPDLTAARIDAPIPRWLPGISFLQASADLLAALDTPRGHGHRYDADQGTRMGSC
ncbi:alpha/beta-hydrolase family protein [Nocardia sp. CNY236]|uniref:alpha/beta-hydrolase family protein n=1 Tax=Nocardia sp. CNY236 TaxID=1169152 RepID=UPI00040B1909|nr:alpha/beta-hydrolase family protein [Nocardia sp. CNY236]